MIISSDQKAAARRRLSSNHHFRRRDTDLSSTSWKRQLGLWLVVKILLSAGMRGAAEETETTDYNHVLKEDRDLDETNSLHT